MINLGRRNKFDLDKFKSIPFVKEFYSNSYYLESDKDNEISLLFCIFI